MRLREVIARGWRDAWHFIGGRQLLLALALIPPVGFALHYLRAGREAMTAEVEIWLIYGLAATGIVFLAILAWSLAAAPYRIERDRHNETRAERDHYRALVGTDDKRDVPVSEAMAYVGYREWGRTFGEWSNENEGGVAEYSAFVQAAADGLVPVWGLRNHLRLRSDPMGVLEPVRAEYWRTHRIEWFGLLEGVPRTEPRPGFVEGERFDRLMTSRAAVERMWPATVEDPERR